jgi:integrase
LEGEAPIVIIRPVLSVDRAIDLFLGDLARRGCTERTRKTYARLLDKFCDRLPDDYDVSKITTDDCRRWLDTFAHRARGTQAHAEAVLASFVKWLYLDGKIARNPVDRLQRTKRIPPDDLDVVTVQTEEVIRMLQAATGWSERLALAILCYTGARRRAVANLRLRDYDRLHGRLRFHEKGGKVIWKPVPDALRLLLEAAIAEGAIVEAEDYLIPPEGYLSRKGDRDDRVIWRPRPPGRRARRRARARARPPGGICCLLPRAPPGRR